MRVSRIMAAAAALLGVAGFASAQTELVGAGATFPAPLYSKMFDQYGRDTGVRINYQAIGSGAGQSQLKNKTVDFGASDVIMTERDLATAPAQIVQIPIVAGAVVVTYNLPGNPTLRFTPDVVADLFLGKITRWNDPRITALNPSTKLPGTAITVVHRSDGSGTTATFSGYLAAVSPQWAQKVGAGLSLQWPAGVGGKGNPGVAGLVKQLPGSVGYVELIYALQNKMPFATLKNKSGNWIIPSLASTTAAAEVAIPEDITRISLLDTASPTGYPLATFTWILLYKEQSYSNRPQAKAEGTVKLIWWMLHDGQKLAEPLEYSALSKSVVSKAEALLRSVTFGGTPLLKD